METLEEIHDGSQTHSNVNRREARYKICDCVRQKESQWKGALKSIMMSEQDTEDINSVDESDHDLISI